MTTTTSPQTPPPHLTEPIFRTYEPHLRTALSNWPNETSFSIPTGIAPSTFVARFRDAILSLKTYNWSTDIDITLLWRLSAERAYCVTREGELVWFRARHRKGAPLVKIVEARAHTASALSSPISLVPWRDATNGEISSLCLLIHHNRIQGPIAVVGKVDGGFVEKLSSTFNVSFVYDEVSNQTIIT